MDISTLSNIITAFRAETRQDAITPDSLGQLLQKIVNVLEQAGEDSTVQQILQWKSTVGAVGTVLKSIALGPDDSNNVILTIGSVNLSTGRGQAQIFNLRKATTQKAGVMSAQHVSDLNAVVEKMEHLAAVNLQATASESDVELTLLDPDRSVFTDPDKVTVTLPVASSSQAGVLSAEDYKKIGGSRHPFYHIQCDTRDDKLIVKYPYDAITTGYVPYLLRFSKKKPRYRNAVDRDRRWYGPVMRGWHLFYDENKIRVALNGEVLFGKNVGTDKHPIWEYTEDKRALFNEIRPEWKTIGVRVDLVGYRIGFGCRMAEVQGFQIDKDRLTPLQYLKVLSRGKRELSEEEAYDVLSRIVPQTSMNAITSRYILDELYKAIKYVRDLGQYEVASDFQNLMGWSEPERHGYEDYYEGTPF